MLRDQVRVEPGQGSLQLQAVAHQPARAGQEAHPGAGHAVAVRHREGRDAPLGGPQRRQRRELDDVGGDRDRAVGDVVHEHDAVPLGQPVELVKLVGGLAHAVGVDRVDQADRARPRRDRGGDHVGVEPVAGGGADRHRHRHAACGQHRGRDVEVARVGQDHLVAGVDARLQRERDRRLSALGTDHLEVVVADAPDHLGGGVAQGLDQIGRVLVERLRGHGPAHRVDRRGRWPAEAREPAQVGPGLRVEAGGATGVDLVGVEAEDRDGVAIRDVVPHRVVARLQGGQARRAPPGRRPSAGPGQHARHQAAAVRARRTTR